MILAFDTSTAACTAALFDGSDVCVARKDELIGRGHSERLVPMIAELLDGRSPDCILVGLGPGSFTGIRVGIAAAHGLAIGWGAELCGMSSLALLAAGAGREAAVAMLGGHGEWLVQTFDSLGGPTSEIRNLRPAEAAATIDTPFVIGSAAPQLVELRGHGDAREAWPSAADALQLPKSLRSLPPRPVYARAPDARAKEAA